MVQSHLPFRNLGNFHLSGVYASGSKSSHTGGKCVTCSGLTNYREEIKFGLFGGTHLRTKNTLTHSASAHSKSVLVRYIGHCAHNEC